MPLAEQRGGAELALMHFLSGIDPAQRHCIQLCFLEAGPMLEGVQALGYRCTLVKAGRLRQPLSLWRTIRALRRWLLTTRVQVALSWMSKAHLYVGPAAFAAGVPAVWWQHGLPTRRSIDQFATLLPARRILACSEAAARAQRALWRNRLAPVVVHPPVDMDSFARLEASALTHAALGWPQDATVVGIVARLQRWKGVHLLIEAVGALLPAHPGLRLLVVGGTHALEPDYPQELRSLCERIGLQSRVSFLGQRSDVPQCMALMDIVVNASHGEPFGMTIIEAMALGKAVVAPRAEGPLEIVTHDIDGVLFDPGSTGGLRQILESLLVDSAYRARLGAAASQRAQQFGIPQFVAGVTDAVAEVAA
jgi:glycosyltransferase involved in cell wall biosynthesis